MPQASKTSVWKLSAEVLPLSNFGMFVYHCSTSLSEHSDKADKVSQLSVKELISVWL